MAVFLTSSFSQDVVLHPTLTINPRTIRLKYINDTLLQPVSVMCTSGVSNVGQLESLSKLTLSRKKDSGIQDLAEVTDTQKSAVAKGPAISEPSKYRLPSTVPADIRTAAISFSVILQKGEADCEDAGEYICTMIYTASGSSTTKENEAREIIEIAPTEFNVTRDPADEPLRVGLKLELTCTAVIGTLSFVIGQPESRLVWVYRNRDSANQNQYNILEQELVLTRGIDVAVKCSKRQTVYLTVTVDSTRDSLRDYFCVVERFFAAGTKPSHVGGSHNNISLPSYETPKAEGIGIGGFIGIGVAALAFLVGSAFGIVWVLRRNKKRSVRKTEIEGRKSQIEMRRQSIASIIVEKKKTMADAESSVAESSVAESSVAESSVAGSQSVLPH